MKNFMFLLASSFVFTSTSIMAIEKNEDDYSYLDALALKAGTDKSSISHNYTKIYAEYFNKYRKQPIKFLEIGILLGNSVKLWEEYFPSADMHFIDIDSSKVEYYSLRSHYHFLNQADPSALRQFVKSTGGDFDIIIDDGGHRMDQQIISFQELFPHVKSGGLYVIEDLHTSYWRDWGGNGSTQSPLAGPGTAVHFLQNLVDDLNYTGAVLGVADPAKVPSTLQATLNVFQDSIYSMHFYKSLCIVIKK